MSFSDIEGAFLHLRKRVHITKGSLQPNMYNSSCNNNVVSTMYSIDGQSLCIMRRSIRFSFRSDVQIDALLGYATEDDVAGFCSTAALLVPGTGSLH
jgi:hypothetical protein